MKSIPAGLASHLAGGVTTLSRCWKLERRDGVVLGFTDFDRDLSFDGVVFQAGSGFNATAIEAQLGLAVSNLDVDGALSSSAITEADLHAGRYDDASVTIWLVNWGNVADRVTLRKGHLGQVSRGKLAFQAELRGLAARLDQSAGRIYQRTCMWDLGDSRCGVNLAAVNKTATGTISALVDRFGFQATGLTAIEAGALARGRLLWLTGLNAGIAVEIKTHSLSGAIARIGIALPMGASLAVGDTFQARVGCEKTKDACSKKFGNIVNFGGFPDMPGNDFAMSYPNTGDQNDGGKL
jgi:uncharacterized phage protein (TIGR02218 family)